MSNGITRVEMQALARMGGLTVEGNETLAELSEAVGYLVRGRRYFRSAGESPEEAERVKESMALVEEALAS